MSSGDADPSAGEDGGVRSCLTHRGYSDSVIPSCRRSSEQENNTEAHECAPRPLPPCTCSDRSQNTPKPVRTSSLSQRVRPKTNLQLPSFRSLGITAGIAAREQPGPLATGALPTPPEETSFIDSLLPPILPGELSRSISFPDALLPQIPDLPGFPAFPATKTPNELAGTVSEHTNPTTPNANPQQSTVQEQAAAEQAMSRADAGTEDSVGLDGSNDDSDENGFVVGAIPFTSRVVSYSNAPVLYAMCYTQPCPLEGADTAFNPVLADMEGKAREMGKYIEVTYQMPPKFNMNQIPSSPAATPDTASGGVDYFSTHIYTRGIVAQGYESALAQAGSSSPRPAVAPGSINVAMLERYIPPPSLDEYTNLFSTDMPSALVDRLFELSPNHGTFVFVYPTAKGAKTFFSTYLRPLLDPLLRTIASTHDLSADLPASVGAIASLHGELLPFDKTLNKINLLLRKLSRPMSVSSQPNGRLAPTFTLVHSDKSVVDIGKTALVDWWLEQEKGRIRKAVERYFHARRADSTMGMVAKIEEGLRKRDYNDYDAEREGIEVGLYVITRTS